MAWKTEITMLVRNLIGDVDESNANNTTYTDDRLYETILVSAQLTQDAIDFTNTYTVDIDQCTLSPDPTNGTKDNAFINLVSLKAACIIMSSEAKTAALSSVNFVDGPSKIDGRGPAERLGALAKSACQAFEDAKYEYKAGGGTVGGAIVGPFGIYDSGGYYNVKR